MARFPGIGSGLEGGARHDQFRLIQGRGLGHVSTTLLQQQGGFRPIHVPCRGGGPALQDALSAQVPLLLSNVIVSSQHIKAGMLRPFGVANAGETHHVPGLESFEQQGFACAEAPARWAFHGRAGTPPEILKHMEDALHGALANAEVRARIEEQGADVVASGRELSGATLRSTVGLVPRTSRP